jgi:hypothetical protein
MLSASQLGGMVREGDCGPLLLIVLTRTLKSDRLLPGSPKDRGGRLGSDYTMARRPLSRKNRERFGTRIERNWSVIRCSPVVQCAADIYAIGKRLRAGLRPFIATL